jgi:hypothetical protein
MSAQPTNRDLYVAVSAIQDRHRGGVRTLEPYLLALRELARPFAAGPAIPFDAFVRLLDEAHTAPAPPFDDAWRALPDLREPREGFAEWEQFVIHQVRGLREMEEAGTMENEYRYFGVNAPRGDRWYNFDPASYLEGAVVGTFGGWEPEDGGRIVVPGPVAVLAEDGTLHSVDASEIEHPVFPLPEVTWEDFTAFLQNGQWYE